MGNKCTKKYKTDLELLGHDERRGLRGRRLKQVEVQPEALRLRRGLPCPRRLLLRLGSRLCMCE